MRPKSLSVRAPGGSVPSELTGFNISRAPELEVQGCGGAETAGVERYLME
jgi:hypothetical protein